MAIHRSGRRSSLLVLRTRFGATRMVSRSMSGWRKRLNKTRPLAPAWVSRSTMLGSELKNGPSLTAMGIVTTFSNSLDKLDVARFDVAGGQVGIGDDVVDIQLQGIGAGLLDQPAVAGPTLPWTCRSSCRSPGSRATAWPPRCGGGRRRARCCSRPSRGSTKGPRGSSPHRARRSGRSPSRHARSAPRTTRA